jgi:beta-glucosidase
MREIYLPAFEAAVTQAHVDAVMNSYNLVNGAHATQNEFLNLKVLKGEWGFQGILMSDWVATYDGVAAANNGLDLEMPSADHLNAQTLVPAVKSGLVKESTIDEHVLRLLRAELRYGFTSRPQFDPADSTYSVADRSLALEEALESITLLKNEGGVLPLDAAKVKTIAIIGPNAYPAVTGGGGSSQAQAFEPVSVLTGIANLLGPDAHVLYSRGLSNMTELFENTRWPEGVKVESFANRDFSGTPQTGKRDKVANWDPKAWEWNATSPDSIRYTAAYKAAVAGKYQLVAAASGGDSYWIFVDGKQMLAQPHAEGQVPQHVVLDLAAGQTVHVQADYLPFGSLHFSMGLAYEPELVSKEAVEYAKLADAVVVAAGFDATTEGEGQDRTFAMPLGQDALIEAVAAANPRTVVLLTGGGGMDTSRWLAKTPALVHLFYPGQEGGTAVAEILFGKHSPEGKLPVSFDRSWEENPSAKWYYADAKENTTLHATGWGGKPEDFTIEHIHYGDKLMVGYRYWTSTGKHPLFPFGFGLSYTSFRFANLTAPATAASGTTVEVGFDVTNTGSVAGAEVAELYVSDPSAKSDRPERELKGFAKVRLAPGETQHVKLALDARAFSYWDEAAHKWRIDPGKFVVRVGDSSENTPLEAAIEIQ